ncbi:fumarate hydratase [candidate division WOR-3 bacterium]|nr:fumarate hydratase [candidate division WOR-3 bacterium]MCK4527190.1 fumarate hydratase [candidate division WOR-3 bacterium]
MEDQLVEAIRRAETQLPNDVVSALEKAYEVEEGPARVQVEAILENIKVSRETGAPMCQDTGIQTFYIEVGADFPYLGELKDIITNAVKRASGEIPLRPNTVNPFTGENPGNNVGNYVPYITWDIVKGEECTIHLLPKGGGSENMCALNMMAPGKGIKGLKRFVVDHIVGCGGKPCPPTVVGIGVGGGADLSLKLGKKSLLRDVGVRHPEPHIAELEEELLKLINESGVGPMGVGGKTTVLDVHIEYAHRHPASFPIGIAVQCWADRRSTVRITKDGRAEVI